MTKEEAYNKVEKTIEEYFEFIGLVKRMRDTQKQWKDGNPFDCTEMELAKKMYESEREVDEYLKKMEERI